MIIFMVFILGLIYGSFINALVWRVHKKRKWWGKERSICPKCKHQLSAQDLVPIASWLFLKGKCRYCQKPISTQYPFVELLTAGLFSLSYIFWPIGFTVFGVMAFIVWLFCVVVALALLVYDAKWLLLPNGMVATLTVSSVLLAFLIALDAQNAGKFVYATLSGLVFYGLLYGLYYYSYGKWIGGGDVKMAFALGVIAGTIPNVFLLIFLASGIGTIITAPLLLTNRLSLKAKVPFGPLLIIATFIIFLFGSQLINWYLTTFLYY